MEKRFLAFVLSLLMVGTLCTLPVEASVGDCNFYLEFVSFGEPGCHVNWDDQVKWVGYSHCVNLYHKVGQDYVKIDAGSLTSSNPSVVSVEYCETDKCGIGATKYYYIRQLTVGTATLSYTYTIGGHQYSASYEYEVETGNKTLYLTTAELNFYTGFGFGSGFTDWSRQKLYGIRFYTSADEDSVIRGEDAIQFPKAAGEFTYQGDGYWDWDPTNAAVGTYQITYTHDGRTQFVNCFVNSDEDGYSGDRMYLTVGRYYSGIGRSKGQGITGISFYTEENSVKKIVGQEGFTFPEGGGTFTYRGDGLWDWDSSSGIVGKYEILYIANGETYVAQVYVNEPLPSDGQCGDNAYWTLHNDGTLTISGTGEMWDYDYGDFATSPWANFLDDVKKVVVEDGVTTIGNCAFAGCVNLESIEIPDSVESIGFAVVCNCNNLKVLSIPGSVTAIAERAFAWCDNLEEITVPFIGGSAELDESREYNGTANYDHFSYAFGDTIYPDTGGVPATLKTVTVTTGNLWPGAFYECCNIENIYISDFSGGHGITDNCFYGCQNLKKLVFDGGKETPCSGVTIPDYVIHIGGYAFCDCDSLTNIDLGAGMEIIYPFAFYDCNNLTSVAIPKTVSEIGEYAFGRCSSLSDVYFEGNEEQWNAIDIDELNYWLLESTTIHYDSLLNTLLNGDLNGDGIVDVLDMACLYTYLAAGANEGTLNDSAFQTAADVNGDTHINILDYQALYEMIRKTS